MELSNNDYPIKYPAIKLHPTIRIHNLKEGNVLFSSDTLYLIMSGHTDEIIPTKFENKMGSGYTDIIQSAVKERYDISMFGLVPNTNSKISKFYFSPSDGYDSWDAVIETHQGNTYSIEYKDRGSNPYNSNKYPLSSFLNMGTIKIDLRKWNKSKNFREGVKQLYVFRTYDNYLIVIHGWKLTKEEITIVQNENSNSDCTMTKRKITDVAYLPLIKGKYHIRKLEE